ncbi:DUF1800 domain-containing protein [Aquisalinus flavus]|nr:DUF1800 domain-containing protein [Aquisalinus flavus]UNE49151.1 DUF1800 domain-containing protein [Aquisalinus flavus]
MISGTDAARFLLQAQMTARPEDIAAVQELGPEGWLEAEFARPRGQTGVDWLTAEGFDKVTPEGEYFWPQYGDWMAWNQMLTGDDQMRKRAAFALSQFFVVSLDPIDGFWPPYMIAAYWDLLCKNAFGNFRDLLEKISLNAAMGLYLNTKGNLKEDEATGRRPDENYAREIMQLFTIGLYELNPDGTLKRDDNGEPIETYTQDDITNLARVFTGYDYNQKNVKRTDVEWLDYPVPSVDFALDPMALDAAEHSFLEVNFLGKHIPAGTHPSRKFPYVHDVLFNHPNVGPFFGRQMIQRLVKSNPSPSYVARVTAAFNDNGEGVRGDLKAVWKAVLLDPEARTVGTGDLDGKLREPVLRFAQWARTVGVEAETGTVWVFNTSRSDNALGQSPLRSPSVFNYFRPGYVPPQTAMARADATMPEFQLHNETSTAGYINFLQWMIRWGTDNMRPTYAPLLPLAHDTQALVDWLNLHFAAGQLSAETCAVIGTALASKGVTEDSADSDKKDLLASACLLVMASPEYLIQK